MFVQIDSFGASHVGQRRSTNEDQFLIADLNNSLNIRHTTLNHQSPRTLFDRPRGQLFVVADGMGGHQAGDRASEIVVQGVMGHMLTVNLVASGDGRPSDEQVGDELRAALFHSRKTLQYDARRHPDRRLMGTTLTMAYVVWPRVYIGHAGDSRCYLLHGRTLKQVTRDHTLQQLYEESRAASNDDSEVIRPQGHVLWNAISTNKDGTLWPDVYADSLEIGDAMLLCSDGLFRHVAHPRIQEVLRSDLNARETCYQLIDEANAGGGSDNITVVVAKFLQPVASGSTSPYELKAEPHEWLQFGAPSSR